MKHWIVLAVLLLLSMPLIASVKDEVSVLVDGNRYDEAAVLIRQQKDWRKNSELRFLYARVLAWGGKIQLALKELDAMLYTSPDNVDFMLMKSRLLFWINKYDGAVVLLKTVVTIAPQNEEAWLLIFKLLRAQESVEAKEQYKILLQEYQKIFADRFIDLYPKASVKPKSFARNYKIFADLAISGLSNNSPNWIEQLYGAAFTNNKYLTPVVSVSRLSRFDIIDSNLSLEIYAKYRVHSVYAGFGTSLYKKLIPNYSYTAKYELNPSRFYGAGVSYKHDRYPLVNNQTGAVELRASYAGFDFVYKASSTFVGDLGRGLSNGVVLRYSGIDKLVSSVGLSYGDELEVDGSGDVSLYQVTNYQLGFKYQMNRHVDLSLTFVRHIQGSVYVRSGLASGFSISY